MRDIFATGSCCCQQLIRDDEAINLQPMVANTKEDFAARLNSACINANPPITAGRGLKAELRRRVAAVGLDVSVESVRKWLCAESIPSMDNLRFISIALGCNADWLLTGREFTAPTLVCTELKVQEPQAAFEDAPLSEEALQLAGLYNNMPADIRAEFWASIVKSLIDLKVKYPNREMGNITDLLRNI